MKSIRSITILLVISVLAGCTPTSNRAKQEKELSDLKKQAGEIQIKIKTLEDQLKDTTKENVKLVLFDTVAIAKFKHYLEIQGKVDADQNVTISAQMPGTITAIKATTGEHVRKGQVLATLDNGVGVAGLDELKNQLQFATTIYEKQKALWEKKIGSEVQYLQAKNNKEALEKKLATTNEQLDMSTIKSPIDGTVDEIYARIGQPAAPGAPAFRVVNYNNLKVKADVPESYTANVIPGNDAIIYIPDLKREIPTKLAYSGMVINPQTRTFTAEAKLDPKPEYRPNMVALLKIVDYKADKAIVVPLNIVQRSGNGNYVMVAEQKDGKLVAHRVNVEVGGIYAGQAEIKSGLSVGDKIITTGFQDLNEGDLLKVN